MKLTTNMRYITEHVHMNHPWSKELTYLYHMYQRLSFDLFASSLKVYYKTLTCLPKHFPNKLNQGPCIICYTENMTDLTKGKKQLIQITGEIIHMDFAFYNVTSIRGLSFIITAVCSNTRMLWVFINAPKQSTVCIICFILTTLKT